MCRGGSCAFAAGTLVGVVVADAYSYATQRIHVGTSVDPFAFEQSADKGAFIDEYTALKEIVFGIGKDSDVHRG